MRYQKPGRTEAMKISQLYRARVHLIIMWQPMYREHPTSLPSGLRGSHRWGLCKEHLKSHQISLETLTCGRPQTEFWEPCKQDQDYFTLTPGDDDCCRMCPNTDAEELVPCAWRNSWAHYRCTYAVGPGRACASHFKVVNPLDKIVVARSDDPMVPNSQHNKHVFPNCCHPRVREHGTPSPSNVHYTAKAIWVYKHAWRGVGAYYRKGDHLQKKKTGNTPVEFKALRMFPEWERWIVPKPTFLTEQLLKEAATLEEKGEPKNRVKRRNIFEHYKEGFQPHTLTHIPGVIQAFKEYRGRSNLNPKLKTYGVAFGNPVMSRKRDSGRSPLNTMQNILCPMRARSIMQLTLVKITRAIDQRVMTSQMTSHVTMTNDLATTPP